MRMSYINSQNEESYCSTIGDLFTYETIALNCNKNMLFFNAALSKKTSLSSGRLSELMTLPAFLSVPPKQRVCGF